MKNILLATVAVVVLGTAPVFAVAPTVDVSNAIEFALSHDLMQLADNDSGDSGNSASGDNDSDDNDSNDDNSNDEGAKSNSDRQKQRVPGGSGCDDPGDIAEHPECKP